MTVQVISPVRELLEQWLLLPLFADLGMIVVVLRSVRNRAGYALSALLALFAASNAATIWHDAPGALQVQVACESMLPALAALFVLSYAGGRHLSGPRKWRALILILPAAVFGAFAVLAGIPAGSPAILAYSLIFFGSSLSLLAAAGTTRSLSGEEPTRFLAALILIIGSGPVYGLLLPYVNVALPIFPYFSAAAGAILAQATLKYKAFSEAPAAAQTRSGGTPLPTGLFIARMGEGRRVRAMFSGAVRNGAPGAIITRTHPGAVRRQTGLAQTAVIWLANSSYEKALPPARVDVLSRTIRDLGEQCDGTVVLIEDLDYLVTNAGLFPTLDMLQEVRRQAERASMTVLLSSDLLTDDERRELRDLGIAILPRESGSRAPA